MAKGKTAKHRRQRKAEQSRKAAIREAERREAAAQPHDEREVMDAETGHGVLPPLPPSDDEMEPEVHGGEETGGAETEVETERSPTDGQPAGGEASGCEASGRGGEAGVDVDVDQGAGTDAERCGEGTTEGRVPSPAAATGGAPAATSARDDRASRRAEANAAATARTSNGAGTTAQSNVSPDSVPPVSPQRKSAGTNKRVQVSSPLRASASGSRVKPVELDSDGEPLYTPQSEDGSGTYPPTSHVKGRKLEFAEGQGDKAARPPRRRGVTIDTGRNEYAEAARDDVGYWSDPEETEVPGGDKEAAGEGGNEDAMDDDDVPDDCSRDAEEERLRAKFAAMVTRDLKPLLKARGLKSSGRKALLVDRLVVSHLDELDAAPSSTPRSFADAASGKPPAVTPGSASPGPDPKSRPPIDPIMLEAIKAQNEAGRLLNLRPKRNVATDGIADYTTIVSMPDRANKGEVPSDRTYQSVRQAFLAILKVDPKACLLPIYDTEPGCYPLPPLRDPKTFPASIQALESCAQVSNPWDLIKVQEGATDREGKPKHQKATYTTVRLHTSLELNHVLNSVTASLVELRTSVRKKDMDALASVQTHSLVGTSNDFDALAVAERLMPAFEEHERWLQTHSKSGYNARQWIGQPFPPMVWRKVHVRLPQGSDVLSEEDRDFVDYHRSLRNLITCEVSLQDRPRTDPLLDDFATRGKFNLVNRDCDVLKVVTNGNMSESSRIDFCRTLICQMNFQHVHRTDMCEGFLFIAKKTKVEMAVEGAEPPCRHASIKREIGDIRRRDGNRVFIGVMQAGLEHPTAIHVLYYNDDLNEAFALSVRDHLPAYLKHYWMHVRGFSDATINSLMGGFTCKAGSDADYSTWDAETQTVKPLSRFTNSNFLSKMTRRGLLQIPDELRRPARKGAKIVSDAAMKRVAEAHNFTDKPGFKPKRGDAPSNVSDGNSTLGNGSVRSVTTQDIQAKLPEHCVHMNQLKDKLVALSPDDELLKLPIFDQEEHLENLSQSSSPSTVLAALFKDTKACIVKLTSRIADLEYGHPPPSSGSATPSPAQDGHDVELAQGG